MTNESNSPASPVTLEQHTKAVGDWLNELYAVMVDPCAEGVLTIKQMCDAIMASAELCRELAGSQDAGGAARQGEAVAPEAKPTLQDYQDSVMAMFAAVGYTEEYARQWPKEKVSVTFKRWFDEQISRAAAPPAPPAPPDRAQRSGVSADPLPDLHAQIMNLPGKDLSCFSETSEHRRAYQSGHRDARLAAAELASQHQVKKGELS